jgi:hypothetical protein
MSDAQCVTWRTLCASPCSKLSPTSVSFVTFLCILRLPQRFQVAAELEAVLQQRQVHVE